MAESAFHRRLVLSIRKWIIENVDEGEKIIIWTDTPENKSSSIPIRIDGFIPDVYAKIISNFKQIVGEAKTAQDIDSQHTEVQLRAFLRYCNNNYSLFLFAVPWDLIRYAKTFIDYLKIDLGVESVKTIILEKLS